MSVLVSCPHVCADTKNYVSRRSTSILICPIDPCARCIEGRHAAKDRATSESTPVQTVRLLMHFSALQRTRRAPDSDFRTTCRQPGLELERLLPPNFRTARHWQVVRLLVYRFSDLWYVLGMRIKTRLQILLAVSLLGVVASGNSTQVVFAAPSNVTLENAFTVNKFYAGNEHLCFISN